MNEWFLSWFGQSKNSIIFYKKQKVDYFAYIFRILIELEFDSALKY